MNREALGSDDFEAAYELLAAAIDRVGRDQESEFLVRLALLLMQAPVEIEAVRAAIIAAEAALL
jgi:hypothetical protein